MAPTRNDSVRARAIPVIAICELIKSSENGARQREGSTTSHPLTQNNQHSQGIFLFAMAPIPHWTLYVRDTAGGACEQSRRHAATSAWVSVSTRCTNKQRPAGVVKRGCAATVTRFSAPARSENVPPAACMKRRELPQVEASWRATGICSKTHLGWEADLCRVRREKSDTPCT